MKKLVFLLLLVPSLASAGDNMILKYEVNWGGFKAGELNLNLKEDAGKYNYVAMLDSTGLAKRISKYWSANITTGKLLGGKYLPSSYNTRWRFKKENKEIVVSYNDKGEVLQEVATPPERRDKNPEVPPEIKKDGLDPITAGVVARKKVMELEKSGAAYGTEFTIPVFDARRKFDIHFTYKGHQTLKLHDKDRDVVHVTFYREPIAGFSQNQLDRSKEQDPNIDVYLDPQTYVPVWAIGKAPLGSATFVLAESCVNQDGCK
jgi:hypothetical protein